MDNSELQDRVKAVKTKIEKLISDGRLDEAKTALDKYNGKMPGDADICSMRAVIAIMEGSLDEAETFIAEGLKKDSIQFDLLYNLAYIKELQGLNEEAADLYRKAETVADTDERKQNVNLALEKLKEADTGISLSDKAKIVFFVKEGMDSFLGDVIKGLDEEYWVRKIVVSDLRQIDAGMQWADVCWFEWCDELVIYGGKLPLAREKKIICRLHSYEAFTQYINDVTWENVDKVIFISEHIRNFVLDKRRELRPEQTIIIPNGINPDLYTFRNRNHGFNIAYVGYINYKKGPMLLLHTFKALYDRDKRYKLYIAGKFQDYRDDLYFSQMIREFGIENNVIYEGWQNDIDHWLEDKNYILCTSILESQNISVMQAMCKGIKPIVHNFVGARGIYAGEYIWNTIDEAVAAITAGTYESKQYRAFVENKYSLDQQLKSTGKLIKEMLTLRELIGRVKNILEGTDKPEELMRDDLTVLIPCYNRAKMIKEDIEEGLKLGRQTKLIIDDCSAEEEEWLSIIENEQNKYKSKLIRKVKNSGVAESRRLGLEVIQTKYTTFIDDDNIMACIDRTKAVEAVSQLNEGYSIAVPRYILNYYKDKLTLGYDRTYYNGMSGKQVLKELASSGEMMGLLTGGAIGESKWMAEYSSCPLFRVSEDFVMLTRMMASKPEMKITITDGLVFVRRFLDEGSTLNPTPLKLMLSLFSQAVSCFYCLKLSIATKEEVLNWMKDRAVLIQKLYNFGESFETELIAYLMGEISEEVFIHFISLNGLKLDKGTAELAPEIPKMRALFYTEPGLKNLLINIKEPPLVSIIIPTYNRKDMLKRAINQAVRQDYPNIEVIVSDNCSEDGTEEMIRSGYKDEKILVYHRNNKNVGPLINYQNAFYSLAKGKYCLMLSDDDFLIDSTYLSKSVKLLEENKDLAFTFSGYYYNHEINQNIYRIMPDYPDFISGDDFFINFTMKKYIYMPNQCTTLFRTENAKKMEILKCDPNCLASDLSTLLRLLLSGNAGFVNNISLVYTLHKKSVSLNPEATVVGSLSKTQKIVESAVQDINEMKNISLLAMDRFDASDLNNWLNFRIWKYMYWRFNETVQTRIECEALAQFMLKDYPEIMKSLWNVVEKRFGENVSKGVV